jgi:CHAT domain-containing protein/tetratricopeptide (TPR) repeat protein
MTHRHVNHGRDSRPAWSQRIRAHVRPVRLLPALLLYLAALHLRGAMSTEPRTVSPVEFRRGASLSRELRCGGEEVFEFRLDAGHYLNLSVNKGDLKMSLALYGPSGQKLVEHASHSFETLTVSLVVDSPGVYRAVARSLERAESVGQFELTVEQAGAASPSDEQEFTASRAFAEAGLLRAEWEAASLRRSAGKFKEASGGWRSSGHPRRAALALAKAAEVYFVLGEYDPALKLYEQAAAVSRRAGDLKGSFESLAHAGLLNSYLGDNAEAEKRIRRALDFYEQQGGAGLPPGLKRAHAEALGQMGEVEYSKGSFKEAAEVLRRSLAMWAEVRDRDGEAHARLFVGFVSAATDGHDAAPVEYERALELYRTVGNLRGEAQTLMAFGANRTAKGDPQSGLNLQLEAGRIFRRIGDRQNEALAMNGVAQIYEDLNEKQAALDTYKQVLELFTANRSFDFASTMAYQIGYVYRALGETEQALKHYEECVRLSRAAGKARLEAYALKDIADLSASRAGLRQPPTQYAKALRLFESIGDRRGQGLTLNSIGDFYSLSKRAREARSFYRKALPLTRAAGDPEAEIATLYNVARAERNCGALEEALARVEESIRMIEPFRARVAGPDLRSSFFASVRKHYELQIDLLMQLDRRRPGEGFAVAALGASESARARTLLEILAEASANIRESMSPDLLAEERELQQRLVDAARQPPQLEGGAAGTGKAAEAAGKLDRLTADYHALQARMREQNPRYAALAPAKSLSLEEIRTELREDPDALLLEFALGEERSYLWAVTPESFDSYELPARATLEGAAREVYTLLTARQKLADAADTDYQARLAATDRECEDKASALSKMLLGPVAAHLGRKRVLVITEGVLQYIPFDALPIPQSASDGKQDAPEPTLMLSHHEIVNLPSISALAAIRRERRGANRAPRVVAVLADPVFELDDQRLQGGAKAEATEANRANLVHALRDIQGLGAGSVIPRLSYASGEADAIVKLAPADGAMLAKDFDASRATLTSPRLAEYQVVHLATHGLANAEHPELSGLLLSMVGRDGRGENGFIQLHDIYALRFSAELVVLSACSTGLGENVKGEGLVGLTRGFMYAGSKGVVASLWKVDDQATAELMSYFYKSLLKDKLPPAAALRAAKEQLRRQKRWRAPFYWAAFVLQGEYTQRVEAAEPAERGSAGSAATLAVALVTTAGLLGVIYLLKRRRRTRTTPRAAHRW